MKKFYLFFFLVLGANLYGQTLCETGRYAENVFPNFTVTSDIVYGQNQSFNGNNTSLKLDFYEPTGDTETARPLIIWVHGGSFIGGSKTDVDVKTWSERFAKKGYACASIDYRLGFFPFDSANAVKAVVRATQDLKGAIRFFYKDRATTNTYKIDTTRIFIGGSSAGAITALHVAYLDDVCEIQDYLTPATISQMGGLEGTSGNPGYSTKVIGVINGCGALARYSWLEAGDVPLCSVHGTNDGTVKYNRGIVNPGTPLMYLDGSRMIHERACAVDLDHQFYTFPGAPHVPYAGTSAAALAYMDTTERFVRDFLVRQLGCTQAISQPENAWMESAPLYPINYCDNTPVDEVCPLSAGIEEEVNVVWNVYPNPTSGSFTVLLDNGAVGLNLAIYDVMGRKVKEVSNYENGQQVNIENLKRGSYFVSVLSSKNNKLGVKQLIVE
ncbi:MAG: hypothetical protein RL264_911 [Bacteroidota bacterium]|jgi:poly(3-hydroxybutyrate) depolymerase